MTKTMIKTMSVTAGTVLAAAILLAATGSATSGDAAYCDDRGPEVRASSGDRLGQ